MTILDKQYLNQKYFLNKFFIKFWLFIYYY